MCFLFRYICYKVNKSDKMYRCCPLPFDETELLYVMFLRKLVQFHGNIKTSSFSTQKLCCDLMIMEKSCI